MPRVDVTARRALPLSIALFTESASRAALRLAINALQLPLRHLDCIACFKMALPREILYGRHDLSLLSYTSLIQKFLLELF